MKKLRMETVMTFLFLAVVLMGSYAFSAHNPDNRLVSVVTKN